MLEVAGRRILSEPDEILAPGHSALLIIDMQNDFVSDEGKVALAGGDPRDIRAIVPRIRELLHAARDADVLCVHIQVLTLSGHHSDSDSWLLSKVRVTNSLDWCLEGSWGAEIIPELAPLPGEPVVTKHRSSAFVNTTLDQVLRSNGIKTVVVTGEQTPGCVEATFRDAAYHDYYNVLVEDCVAAYRRDLHAASLLIQRARHDVVSSDDVIRIWKDEEAAHERESRRAVVGPGRS